MKTMLFVTIASCAFILSACTKKKDCCTPPSTPFVAASKNSATWLGKGTSEMFYTDSLMIVGAQTEERLLMRLKFTGKGVYTFKNTQAIFYTTVGQDVSTSEYQVDESAPNTLEVLEYDVNAKMISGTFTLKLKRVYGNPESAYPPTLLFTNGKFSVKLP